MGTRMENSQGLHRKSSGTPALLPPQGSQPQRGKGLRRWPQEDLAVGVNNPAGFQSSRNWAGDSQVPQTASQGQGQSCHHSLRETGCGDTAARDETGMRCPMSAPQPGLGFPAHTRQLLRQMHTFLGHLGGTYLLG